MKKTVGKLKELIFGHVSILIFMLCIVPFVFISKELFQGIEVEQAPSESEDLIVVGVSQLGSESDWRTAHTLSIQNTLTKDAGYFLNFNNARQIQENQIKAIPAGRLYCICATCGNRLGNGITGGERCRDSGDSD